MVESIKSIYAKGSATIDTVKMSGDWEIDLKNVMIEIGVINQIVAYPVTDYDGVETAEIDYGTITVGDLDLIIARLTQYRDRFWTEENK